MWRYEEGCSIWGRGKEGTYRNRQIITPSQLGDLAHIAERGAHDNSLVPVFLVVVEDGLHTLDAGVFLGGKVLLHGSLVPVQDAADKGRDEVGTGLGARDGLHEREHQRQVAVDAVL